MDKQVKTFDFEVEQATADGGRIIITTGSLDRQNDRVVATGAKIAQYMQNPVVQWGHNYRDPWATIGNTTSLTAEDNKWIAEFTLRPAANEADPMHIIRLLWEGGWIKTASIGFDVNDNGYTQNDDNGYDFTDWNLLEWSLVPVPANAEALRLAYKGLTADDGETLATLREEVVTLTAALSDAEEAKSEADQLMKQQETEAEAAVAAYNLKQAEALDLVTKYLALRQLLTQGRT